MPREGLNRKVYRSRKFGSWERSQAMDAQVTAAGKTVGINFRYDLQTHTPNTFDSHRLVWLAGTSGVQDDVVEALFRAYFCEGANFSPLVRRKLPTKIQPMPTVLVQHKTAVLMAAKSRQNERGQRQTACLGHWRPLGASALAFACGRTVGVSASLSVRRD
jgi:hypothetical protein